MTSISIILLNSQGNQDLYWTSNICRSSHSQMFFKIGVLKNFRIRPVAASVFDTAVTIIITISCCSCYCNSNFFTVVRKLINDVVHIYTCAPKFVLFLLKPNILMDQKEKNKVFDLYCREPQLQWQRIIKQI